MDNGCFLSVIIPVYKVEPYLRACVDSVLAQSLMDYELLLVDDGSPDGCPAICDGYAAEHDTIRVIHKPNGGLSSARNAGLEAARGEYVMFMDSDDRWNPEVDVPALLSEVRRRPDVEMFLFSSLDYIEGMGLFKRTEHYNLKNIPTDSVPAYYRGLLDNGNPEVSACTKILRREFLIDNRLSFSEGILGEDNEWIIRVLRKLSSVAILDEPLYICRGKRPGSITSTVGRKNVSDLLGIVSSGLTYYSDPSVPDRVKSQELCFCAYLWFCALGLCSGLSPADRKSLKPLFLQTRTVCTHSRSRKTRLANACLKLFGYGGTLRILGSYISLKKKRTLNKQRVG